MFRFTIRDVLWLTALVAMGAGWGIEHIRLNVINRALVQQQEAEQRIARLRAKELRGEVIIGREP